MFLELDIIIVKFYNHFKHNFMTNEILRVSQSLDTILMLELIEIQYSTCLLY